VFGCLSGKLREDIFPSITMIRSMKRTHIARAFYGSDSDREETY